MCSAGERRVAGCRRQRGYGLLLALLVLVTGAATFFVSVNAPGERLGTAAVTDEAEALARTREFVIARAAADGNRPGSLSCPDLDNDGSAETGAACDAMLGRFPHRTHASRRQSGTDGTSLWYAIDPGLLDAFSPGVTVNPGTATTFEVNGEPGFGAAVIAPGSVVDDSQNGRVSSDPAHYLENGNAGGPPFADCAGVAACNDRVRGITLAELFDTPQRRLLAAVERLLREFFDDYGHLPYAAAYASDECDHGRTRGQLPFSDADSDCGGAVLDSADLNGDEQWIVDNGWLPYVVYQVEADCAGTGAACSAAGLELAGDSGLQVVVVAAGRTLAGQSRTAGAAVTDYLESAETVDGDGVFDDARPSLADNDSLRGFTLP